MSRHALPASLGSSLILPADQRLLSTSTGADPEYLHIRELLGIRLSGRTTAHDRRSCITCIGVLTHHRRPSGIRSGVVPLALDSAGHVLGADNADRARCHAGY